MVQIMVKLTQQHERPEIQLDKLPGQPLPSIELYIGLIQVCTQTKFAHRFLVFITSNYRLLQQLTVKKNRKPLHCVRAPQQDSGIH